MQKINAQGRSKNHKMRRLSLAGGVGARAGIHGNTIVHRFLWFDVFFSTAVDTIVNEMVG